MVTDMQIEQITVVEIRGMHYCSLTYHAGRWLYEYIN